MKKASENRSGGVNIHGSANVQGDVVGRDKIEYIRQNREMVEKSGIAYGMEFISMLVSGILFGGIFIGGFWAAIGAVIAAAFSGGNGAAAGAVAGGVVGLSIALFSAFSDAGKTTRYRPQKQSSARSIPDL
jgi:hypothetical protein